MVRYQKEIIPNRIQPNLKETGIRMKKIERCYYCNEKISGDHHTDKSRKKMRISCLECGIGEIQ
jgi:hypothetical protein